jgi:hypothetical protein
MTSEPKKKQRRMRLKNNSFDVRIRTRIVSIHRAAETLCCNFHLSRMFIKRIRMPVELRMNRFAPISMHHCNLPCIFRCLSSLSVARIVTCFKCIRIRMQTIRRIAQRNRTSSRIERARMRIARIRIRIRIRMRWVRRIAQRNRTLSRIERARMRIAAHSRIQARNKLEQQTQRQHQHQRQHQRKTKPRFESKAPNCNRSHSKATNRKIKNTNQQTITEFPFAHSQKALLSFFVRVFFISHCGTKGFTRFSENSVRT